MTDCVVCDGRGCEFCPKVTEAEQPLEYNWVLISVFLWGIAFWLAVAVLIGWLT